MVLFGREGSVIYKYIVTSINDSWLHFCFTKTSRPQNPSSCTLLETNHEIGIIDPLGANPPVCLPEGISREVRPSKASSLPRKQQPCSRDKPTPNLFKVYKTLTS